MFQLTYISTAAPNLPPPEVERILARSRTDNQRLDITGLLLFDGKRFLQALEGERAEIETLYTRIRSDARHRAAVQLSAGPIASRCFGDWAMAFHAVGGAPRENLAALVDEHVANVPNASLRALFSGFARLRRAA